MNGMKHLNAGMNIGGNEYYVMENPEWIRVAVDGDGKVLCGIKQNGKFYADLDGIDEQVKELIQPLMNDVEELVNRFDEIFKLVDNPEYMSVEIDENEKVLGGRKTDGTKFENAGLDFGGAVLKGMNDPEGRMEVKTDSTEKIISYRKEDGTLAENVGIETNHLELTQQGMSDFKQALKDAGFQPGGAGDWSGYISNDGDSPLVIPEPQCAILNITSPIEYLDNLTKVGKPGAVRGVNYDVPSTLDFYDMNGNYFRKPVLISAQGNSSMMWPKKNISIDLFDTSVYDGEGALGEGDAFAIRIGDMVAQDSYHLKSYYTDAFRAVGIIGYFVYDKMAKTLGIENDYVWKRGLLKLGNITPTTLIDDSLDQFDNGAKCFPYGFPIRVYHNGNFYGIYAMQLKKHRKNYELGKSKAKHTWLDGFMTDLLGSNGNINWDIFNGKERCSTGAFEEVEIRNPKDLYCIDGKKYDADTHMEELMDENTPGYDATNKNHKRSADVKHIIEALSTVYNILSEANDTYEASDKTTEDIEAFKEVFETYFDPLNLMEYQIISDVIGNTDGFARNWQWFTYNGTKWFVGLYDLNDTMGSYDGAIDVIRPGFTSHTGQTTMMKYITKFYNDKLEARYAFLRNTKIIDADAIANLYADWQKRIGKEYYEAEYEKWPNSTTKDSIFRIYQWVKTEITNMDAVYHFNN